MLELAVLAFRACSALCELKANALGTTRGLGLRFALILPLRDSRGNGRCIGCVRVLPAALRVALLCDALAVYPQSFSVKEIPAAVIEIAV